MGLTNPRDATFFLKKKKKKQNLVKECACLFVVDVTVTLSANFLSDISLPNK